MFALSEFVDSLSDIVATARIAPRPAPTPSLFVDLLQQRLAEQCGPEAPVQVGSLIEAYSKAVGLCRKEELGAALAHLQGVDHLVAEVPEKQREFLTLFQLSAWGNYYFKNRQADLALAALTEGLNRSAHLEQAGYYPLIHRRIEQLQNIAMIYYRQQQPQAANELLRNTLRFVHSGHAHGLLVAHWDRARLEQVPALQDSTLQYVFQSVAKHNCHSHATPGYGENYYYHFFYQEALAQLAVTTPTRQILRQWLLVKCARLEAGEQAFLQRVLAFFAEPAVAADYGPLKTNLLQQVVHLIRQAPAVANPEQLIASLLALDEPLTEAVTTTAS